MTQLVNPMSDAGINVKIMAAPMIPYVNDSELETLMEAGKEASAKSVRYILLRLPHEIIPMFQEWLNEHFSDRADKVMSIIRQSRGGKDYRSVFGERMVGTVAFAQLLQRRWQVAAKRLGFDNDHRFELDTTQLTKQHHQMALF